VLKDLEDSAWKSRISEKEQKAFARWQGDAAARRAVYNNRARVRHESRLKGVVLMNRA
jgi:transposase